MFPNNKCNSVEKKKLESRHVRESENRMEVEKEASKGRKRGSEKKKQESIESESEA